jgi:hypothetical protein
VGGKIGWRNWCTNRHSIWCAQGIKLYFGWHFCLFFCTQQTKDLARNTLQTQLSLSMLTQKPDLILLLYLWVSYIANESFLVASMHLIDIDNKVPQGSMKNSNYVRFWCWGRAGQIRVICFAERAANELRHPLLLFEGQGTQGSTIVAMLLNNKTGSLTSLVPQTDVSNPVWTCPSPTLTITSLFMQHKIHDNLESSLANFKPLSMNTAATHQPNWI